MKKRLNISAKTDLTTLQRGFYATAELLVALEAAGETDSRTNGRTDGQTDVLQHRLTPPTSSVMEDITAGHFSKIGCFSAWLNPLLIT